MTVAIDLLSQGEHGLNSPVWLFTESRALGEKVLEIMPKLIADMPGSGHSRKIVGRIRGSHFVRKQRRGGGRQ